IPLASVGMAGV
ncbi:hypothetical protein CFC21_027637, partial [Triticum aestivum]